MTIFLLGFMGSGKSTIGKSLAITLGYNFIDLDHYIENQEGRSVSEIFAAKGEDHFRELETRYLKELALSEANTVLSLGGGTPCFNNNMKLANSLGITVYLQTGNDELYDRLKDQTANRPLLSGKNEEELKGFITGKVHEREPFYNQSKIIFLTDNGRGADELAAVLQPLL